MSALVVMVFLTASPASPLNTEGFKLYQAGKYAEALEKFRAAIAADESHALSQYNLAATLGLLRKQGRVCEFDAYQGTVLEHLELAVKLDEGRRKRMQGDRDFDSVRDTLRYQQLLGRRADRKTDARALLTALTWYTPAVGAYGNPQTLKLSADGRFRLSVLDLRDEGPQTLTHTGRWKLDGFTVTLELAKPVNGVKRARGVLGPDGHLVFSEPAWNFSDGKAECDA